MGVPSEEYEWAARDGRLGRWMWRRSALDPQLAVHHWETCWTGNRVRDANWEQGGPPADLELQGEGAAGSTPHELGELPGLTPELERVAATWAAGQAAERSQRVLELWKANEEKQAALVALKQSEEALHQVWRQVRPPGVGPLITVPSAAPIPEEAHRDPAGGYSKAKCRSRSERARARDAASLVAGGPMRASGSPEEPLTPEGNQPPRGTGRKPLQARRPGRGKPRGPDETGTTWAGEPN